MNIHDMYPTKHLTVEDINKPYELTIAAVEETEVRPNNSPVNVFILRFEKAKKYLILNKTNAFFIAGLYGNDTKEWIGKRIVLYVTQARVKGEMQDVIRLRAPTPNML